MRLYLELVSDWDNRYHYSNLAGISDMKRNYPNQVGRYRFGSRNGNKLLSYIDRNKTDNLVEQVRCRISVQFEKSR